MKFNIKNSIAAAVIAMVGFTPLVFAGGVQVDNKSLVDVLQAKGVLSKDEAKAIKHNNEGKLKFEGEVFANTTAVLRLMSIWIPHLAARTTTSF